ncbi:MAG: S-layer homology domain-containing protein, partial [Clostridia bacterium]|nr:S-layer homology domain-containing protein [Clostridia bacterium]
ENEISEDGLPLVRAALAMGLMETVSTEDGEYFLPSAPISREEAANILGSLSTAVIATTRAEEFSDMETAEESYIGNLTKLIDLQVLIGYTDGTIKPKNTLTLEEFAVILWSDLQNESF